MALLSIVKCVKKHNTHPKHSTSNCTVAICYFVFSWVSKIGYRYHSAVTDTGTLLKCLLNRASKPKY